MRVYVVLYELPYEGEALYSVWSTREAAEQQAAELQSTVRYGSYVVQDTELQGEMPNVIRRERTTKEINPAQLELLLK